MTNNQNPLDNLPFYFRIGSVGTGLGVGCGVGVGFGKPLDLAAIPGMGQVVAGVSSGLGQVGGLMGGMGTGARSAVRGLGVRGLDAGFGCGVGIGYGVGAGLFLKPSVAQQLGRLVEETAAALTQQVTTRLQAAGIALPHPPAPNPAATSHPSPPLPPLPSRAPGAADPSHAAPVSTPVGPERGLGLGRPGLTGTNLTVSHGSPTAAAVQDWGPADSRVASDCGVGVGGMHVGGEAGGSIPPPAPAPEEFRALLRHERQIARLRAQNRALRRAVCRLDRKLPLCADSSTDDEDD